MQIYEENPLLQATNIHKTKKQNKTMKEIRGLVFVPVDLNPPPPYPHRSLERWGRGGTTDDFTTSFHQFSLFSLPYGLGKLQACPFPDVVFSSLVFVVVCLVFFPLSLCLVRLCWQDWVNGRHVLSTSVCVSLRWSGGLRVVQLPAGFWHGLPRW